ncbi:MAG: transposase [Treponema sp.]|jgi:putative transposase|nr:transposase [Treponema sp.]
MRAKMRGIRFLEMEGGRGRARFPAQSAPAYSPAKITRTIKGVTAKEIFKERPEAKERLWGGEFWSAGRYASGEYGVKE